MKRFLLLVMCAFILCSPAAQAQFRYIAPDGTVTYSDQPPPAQAKDLTVQPLSSPAPLLVAASLPYELSTTANNFPVVLYTTKPCDPCDQARNFLKQRGIPFTERTIATDADQAALKRIMGSTAIPSLSVGSQKSVGYAEASWASLLDDAGYPKTSRLPRDYAYASPTPLTPPAATPSAAPAQASATPTTAAPEPFPTPPAPTGNAPPGFHF